MDEIDKAHADVLTVFLQLFDDGRISDSLVRSLFVVIRSLFSPTQLGTIHCEGAVFIMTSNLGSAEIRASSQMLHKLVRETKDRYLKGIGQFVETLYPVLKEKFKRDEFLGRINQTAVFLPFNNEEVSDERYCNTRFITDFFFLQSPDKTNY